MAQEQPTPYLSLQNALPTKRGAAPKGALLSFRRRCLLRRRLQPPPASVIVQGPCPAALATCHEREGALHRQHHWREYVIPRRRFKDLFSHASLETMTERFG